MVIVVIVRLEDTELVPGSMLILDRPGAVFDQLA
jgi:hypothetical protein